jgi:hypothetical protein
MMLIAVEESLREEPLGEVNRFLSKMGIGAP